MNINIEKRNFPCAFSSVISGSSQYRSQTDTSRLSLLASQELRLHSELELLLCLGKFYEHYRSLSFLVSTLYHLYCYQKRFSFLSKDQWMLFNITLKPRKLSPTKRVLKIALNSSKLIVFKVPMLRLAGWNLTSLGNPTRTRTPPVFNSDMYGSNGWSPAAVSIIKSNDLASACK